MLDAATLGALARSAGLREASIVVRSVARGASSVSYDAARPLYPASMIKLPIAFALADLCRTGALRLDDEALVGTDNMTANDAPSPFSPGTCTTLRELAFEMLAKSDNVATNVLIDVLERGRITALARAHGLAATAVHRKLSGSLPLIHDPAATGRNAHPACDAALLLQLVAERTAKEPDWIYDALLQQHWNAKLSAGFAPGDTFAHKTGDTDDEVSHDGGILTLAGGRRYVVVVYTGLPSAPPVDACFAAFARALRPLLVATRERR